MRYGLPLTEQDLDELTDRCVREWVHFEADSIRDSAYRYGKAETICNMVGGMLDAMGLGDYDFDLDKHMQEIAYPLDGE